MLFTTDIDINKSYPAVLYDATESGNTYFEDREVLGMLYRAQNATYSGSAWSPKVSGNPAYATVQNSDGSISHLAWSTLSSSWTGNAQRGIFNVRDFGAVGDGVTDDSAKIQAANDAAVANLGGYIYIPAGTYVINTHIQLGSSNPSQKDIPITIGGEGAGVSTLLAGYPLNGGGAHADITMLVNYQADTGSGPNPYQFNIYIEKLTLNANAQKNHPTGMNVRGPIFLKQVRNCGVRDCEVISSSNHGILISGTGSKAWPAYSVLNFQVLRNHVNLNYDTLDSIMYPGNIPIRVEGAAVGIIHGNTVGDMNTEQTNDAIDCPGSSYIEVSGNYVTMCTDGMGANACSNVIFANNRVVGPFQGFGIATFSSGGPDDGASGVFDLTITGNVVINPGNSGIRVSCPPGGPVPTDFSVTNNVVVLGEDTAPYGIHIEASQGCVTGNVVDLGGNGQTGIAIDSAEAPGGNADVTVTGNIVSNGGSGASGIIITGSSGTVSTNCVITDNAVFGVSTAFSGINHAVNCVVRNNPSINPWMGSVTTPPWSSSPISNPYPFDIWVTVSGASDVLINGNSSGVTSGSVLLPAGSANSITLVYSGAPFWTWLAY